MLTLGRQYLFRHYLAPHCHIVAMNTLVWLWPVSVRLATTVPGSLELSHILFL